jgi:hypothetical protein
MLDRGRFPGAIRLARSAALPLTPPSPSVKSSISSLRMIPSSGTASLAPKNRLIVVVATTTLPAASATMKFEVPWSSEAAAGAGWRSPKARRRASARWAGDKSRSVGTDTKPGSPK